MNGVFMFRVTLLVSFAMATPALATPVYFGLGDSITFGEGDLNYVPSNGDRGYVGRFANIVAARTGTRPIVQNLAVDGETASSFQTGAGRTPPVVNRTDTPLALQNTHYTGQPATPQVDMFNTIAKSEQAAGNTIGTISMTLGFNELGAIATDPNRFKLLGQTLDAYRKTQEGNLLFIRGVAPSANLYLLGYFNPFPGDPTNPALPFFKVAGPRLNALIHSLAVEFHAYYVDTAMPFVGHEAAYTYIAQQPAGFYRDGRYPGVEPIGNVHPNGTGYDVIANQLANAKLAVPEPGAFAVFGIGVVALGMARRRRSWNLPA